MFDTIIHKHYYGGDEEQLQQIIKKLNKMALSQQEAIAKLDAQAEVLTKVKSEVEALKEIAEGAGNVSPELEAAIGRVDAAIKGVDDINEDAPAEEPPAEEPQA